VIEEIDLAAGRKAGSDALRYFYLVRRTDCPSSSTSRLPRRTASITRSLPAIRACALPPFCAARDVFSWRCPSFAAFRAPHPSDELAIPGRLWRMCAKPREGPARTALLPARLGQFFQSCTASQERRTRSASGRSLTPVGSRAGTAKIAGASSGSMPSGRCTPPASVCWAFRARAHGAAKPRLMEWMRPRKRKTTNPHQARKRQGSRDEVRTCAQSTRFKKPSGPRGAARQLLLVSLGVLASCSPRSPLRAGTRRYAPTRSTW
jgi:hypothetical protein